MDNTRIVAIAGVSGSGKTTVGRYLAAQLGWQFWDGDDLHPEANIRKMQQGIPLTDDDRWPWLDAIRDRICHTLEAGEKAVITCSALKQVYRDRLSHECPELTFVYLKGTYEQIYERVANRPRHFMPADLLASQFRDLEEPVGVLTLDVSENIEAIARAIWETLRLEAIASE